MKKALYLLAMVGLVAFPMSASAVQYSGVGGRPAFPRSDNPRTDSIFVHTLEAGASQDEGVLVINNTDAVKTLYVFAADSTPSSSGGFACKQRVEEKKDVGAWITLEKDEVVLQPFSNEMVPFVINVPSNASVGEQNGCILVQEKKEKPKGQTGVSLSFRTGLRVAITVPGELKRELTIVGFSATRRDDGIILLSPKIRNTGNVSIDADVGVVTRNIFGLKAAAHGGEFSVLRDDVSEWNFEMKQPFWGGIYTSKFDVTYDNNVDNELGAENNESRSTIDGERIFFFSPPSLLGLLIEVLVVAAIIFTVYIVRKKRSDRASMMSGWTEYQIKSDQPITKIASILGIDWKVLARENGIKPPYMLSKGDRISGPKKVRKSSAKSKAGAKKKTKK